MPVSEPAPGDRTLVVAAALRDRAGATPRLLAARRSAPAALAGRWELPGGKVEAGESPPAALHRELAEELGIRVRLGPAVPEPSGRWPDGAWPLTAGLRMRVWWATVVEGAPAPLQDHDRLAWLTVHQLGQVPWLDTNTALVAVLASTMRET